MPDRPVNNDMGSHARKKAMARVRSLGMDSREFTPCPAKSSRGPQCKDRVNSDWILARFTKCVIRYSQRDEYRDTCFVRGCCTTCWNGILQSVGRRGNSKPSNQPPPPARKFGFSHEWTDPQFEHISRNRLPYSSGNSKHEN